MVTASARPNPSKRAPVYARFGVDQRISGVAVDQIDARV